MTPLVDILAEIVRSTSERTQSGRGFEVHYFFGHIAEICATLASYGKTAEFRAQKYPAIILLQDFAEQMHADSDPDVERTVRLQILLVAQSNAQDRAAERYAKVFKPILYPLYEQFMMVLNSAGDYFKAGYAGMPHDKIDRPFISNVLSEQTKGATGGCLFNDMLDAIEVRNLLLKVMYKQC